MAVFTLGRVLLFPIYSFSCRFFVAFNLQQPGPRGQRRQAYFTNIAKGYSNQLVKNFQTEADAMTSELLVRYQGGP